MNLLLSIFDNKIIVMEWKHCNTITGSVAIGNQYFGRESVEKLLWHKITKGEHIRFRAPRRTGKTSILKYMAKHPPKHFKAIFQDIESDKSSKAFYIRMIELISTMIKTNDAVWKSIKTNLRTIKIKEIGTRIKIEREEKDYKTIFLDLINHILRGENKYVLFLDEFPDMLLKVSDNEDKQAACDILDTLRSIRQTEQFNQNFVIVLTGSVSLLHVVRKVGDIKVINDLADYTLDDLTKEEALSFINFLTEGATLQVDKTASDYILARLKQYVPFYIQLIIDNCDRQAMRLNQPNLTCKEIDIIWNKIARNEATLENWESRLEKYFASESKFLKEVITRCAHEGSISFNKIFDIAQDPNYNIGDKWKYLMDNILINDGYFQENDNRYTFVSPFLQEWWINKFPIIE